MTQTALFLGPKPRAETAEVRNARHAVKQMLYGRLKDGAESIEKRFAMPGRHRECDRCDKFSRRGGGCPGVVTRGGTFERCVGCEHQVKCRSQRPSCYENVAEGIPNWWVWVVEGERRLAEERRAAAGGGMR